MVSDATPIRALTRETTARLRGFLDTALVSSPCGDHDGIVERILDHATQRITIAHPAMRIESTASTVARCTPLPRAVAYLLVPLLDDAITHGASPHPTRLIAVLAGDRLSLTVADSGIADLVGRATPRSVPGGVARVLRRLRLPSEPCMWCARTTS